MPKIRVKLKTNPYDVMVGAGILKSLGKRIKKMGKRQVVIITDPLVNSLYGKAVRKGLKGIATHTIVVPRGEKHKTLYVASAIYDRMIAAKVHRDALIIALGGGVIGDLAGFVAATYMRGIDLIQVPTTLLAQVDAAIGGKTGVNHKAGKNLIGAFYQPKLVYIDVDTLKTLPARELKTGLAEVIKYGVIKSPRLFALLEKNPKSTPALWQKIVVECVRIKAQVVEKDEKELSGYRMILNFGHTIGHAIESQTEYKAFTHGEAVALGMVAAAVISYYLKLISKEGAVRIASLIGAFRLPVKAKLSIKKIMKSLLLDKKVRKGKVKFVLVKRIGQIVIKDNVPEKIIRKALKDLGCR